MKMDEFNQVLRKALEEKAPVGFTDSIMDKLSAEAQKEKIVSNAPVLGKGFLIILLGLFVIGLISLSKLKVFSESKFSISKYIDHMLAGLNFQFDPSLKILVFSIAAICIFLVLDYFFRSRKMIRI
jgi:hypothetical protein